MYLMNVEKNMSSEKYTVKQINDFKLIKTHYLSTLYTGANPFYSLRIL